MYVNTKVGNIKNVMEKVWALTQGNWRIYLSKFDNSIDFEEGITNEGSLHLGRLSEEKYWRDEGLQNNTCNEYSILRFLTIDNDGNITKSYKGKQSSYTLPESIESRIKFNKLYIEKTVDAHNENTVEVGQELTYTITIKNNSFNDYSNNLIITEDLYDYVCYNSQNCTSSSCEFNKSGNTLTWDIGKLKAGKECIITYTVTVKPEGKGKEIVSTGNVDGSITNKTIKNTVEQKITSEYEKQIEDAYNKLKEDCNGKELINKVYSEAFGIDIKLTDFDINDLIQNDKENKYLYDSALNQNNIYYNNILNNYWGALRETDYLNEEITYKAYSLKYFINSETSRATTIYPETLRTGDILIYKNSDDSKYNTAMTKTTVTNEDGEYAYIFIEGLGFVGKNIGNDGIEGTADDRNEFNVDYYTDNGLDLIIKANGAIVDSELEEFANYQTLLGKDYYVILRPSMVLETEIEISSEEYKIEEEYIFNINANTSVKEFINHISTNASNVFVYCLQNEEMIEKNEEEIIGTGLKLRIQIEDEYEDFVLIVTGDTDGNGNIDFKDLVNINRHRLNKSHLTDEYLLAGDMNEDGKVDFKDMVKVNQVRLNKNIEN